MQRVRRVIIGEEIFLKPKKVLIKNTVSITFTILQIASQIGFLGCYKDKNTKLHNFFFAIPTIVRSSRPEVFCKKSVLRNFAKFTRKHLCQGLVFNKVAGLWHRCFPVNFAKFLRTTLVAASTWWRQPLRVDLVLKMC